MGRFLQCLFFVSAVVGLSQSTTTYDLSLLCGSSITVYSSALLKVYSYSSLPQSCVVTVNSAFHFLSSDRLRLEVRSLNMPCFQSAYLNLYDGSSTGNRLTNQLCSTYAYQSMYVTSLNNRMTIVISNGNSYSVSMALLATATSFSWQSGDFVCTNGYGIESYLHCDGDNNCGDWSDENCGVLTFHARIGVIVGSITFGCVVFVIVLIVVVRRRRRLQTVQYQGFVSGGQNYGTVSVTQTTASGSAYMPAPPPYNGAYGAVPPPAYKAPPTGAQTAQ